MSKKEKKKTSKKKKKQEGNCPHCGGYVVRRSALNECEDCDFWYPTA